MDWLHIGEALALMVSGGYGAWQKAKANRAKAAAQAAVEAGYEALSQEIDATMETFRKSLTRLGPGTVGGALLGELEVKRQKALEIGKNRAMSTYREKMEKR